MSFFLSMGTHHTDSILYKYNKIKGSMDILVKDPQVPIYLKKEILLIWDVLLGLIDRHLTLKTYVNRKFERKKTDKTVSLYFLDVKCGWPIETENYSVGVCMFQYNKTWWIKSKREKKDYQIILSIHSPH